MTNAGTGREKSLWDNVADFRPRLKSHLKFSRHRYRSEIAYILEDPLTAERYRLSLAAYTAVGQMTGSFCLREIHNLLAAGNNNFTREELIETVHELGQMEALCGQLPPQLVQKKRYVKKQTNSLASQIKRSPLYLRLPLFNPQRILDTYMGYVRPLLSKPFLTLLLFFICSAAVQLVLVWPELTNNVIDQIFTRHNLLILWITYPVVKTIHEFAHAFCVKHFGGTVAEMGLMILLFVPVPYVDASESGSFASKWQRIGVAAAGIMAELGLAAVALFVWSSVEPGIIRSFAFNTILICGFSTLLFNGNPLVRFDGYYILSDLIEIPNLARRSSAYLWNIVLRVLTGVGTSQEKSLSPSEKRWFFFYGIASFCYRLTIYLSIFYLFATKLGIPGAIIGIAAIVQILFMSGRSRIRTLLQSPLYQAKRTRLLATAGLFSLIVLAVITIIPLPHATTVEGVVHRPEESLVKMQSPGIITNVSVTPGEQVVAGQILCSGEDQQLRHDILLLESQLQELRLKEAAAFATDPFTARIIREKSGELGERLRARKQQEQELTVTSPIAGRFVVGSPHELTGSYFHQGELLGFIHRPGEKVRTMVSQEDIAPIAEKTTTIDVLLVSEPGTSFTGELVSRNPHATYQLASKTLGTTGGGRILLDPADPEGKTMLTEMFQLDIRLNAAPHHFFPDSRAIIKFNHPPEPLIYRWIRAIRQLFLSRFRA